MKGFSTKAIHGFQPKKDVHNAMRTPVYDSVSFSFDSSKDIQLAFEGKKPAHAYSRITNPTVEDFEQRVRLLTDAFAVIAVASGMAAISNVVMTLCEAGSNLVTSKHMFGNTVSLFEHTLKPWGLNVRYVDMTNPKEVEAAIDENTRMVFLENITNPQLEVADVKAISVITKEKNIPLVVDGTVTTPYLFKSKDFGVDIEVISSTKYMSGGATSVGGLIIDNGTFNWKNSAKLGAKAKALGPMTLMATIRREVYRNTGACLPAHNAYLQSLGLETMALRIDQSCQNALELAQFLEAHPKVESVNYPGLESSSYHQMAKEQFGDKYGGILTFSLKSQVDCYSLMDQLKLIKRATNINDNKTMIIHPFSTIFCEYSEEKRLEMQVLPTTMRLSVGIEDQVDIQEDIKKGLETL